MFGRNIAIIALVFSFSIFVLGSTEALAAKGGGAHKSAATTGSFSLVLVNTTDGLPHWGQQVTFNITTTTTEPHVSLQCRQGGVLVYSAQSGYYASYPWPWTQVMTLSSSAWTGGSADCVATLYYFSGTNTVSLGTLSITVYP